MIKGFKVAHSVLHVFFFVEVTRRYHHRMIQWRYIDGTDDDDDLFSPL